MVRSGKTKLVWKNKITGEESDKLPPMIVKTKNTKTKIKHTNTHHLKDLEIKNQKSEETKTKKISFTVQVKQIELTQNKCVLQYN